MDDATPDTLREAQAKYVEIEGQYLNAARKRAIVALLLHSKGYSYAELARIMGVSRPRAIRIVQKGMDDL